MTLHPEHMSHVEWSELGPHLVNATTEMWLSPEGAHLMIALSF